MPIELILPGRIVDSTTAIDPEVNTFLNVEVRRAQVVDEATRGAPAQEHSYELAEDTDIIEREWQNGIKQWMSVAQLREDLEPTNLSRGDSASALRVPTTPPMRQVSRGAPDWMLKALKILRVSHTEELAKWSARKIVEHFENKLRPEAGLYRLSDLLRLEEQRLTTRDLDDRHPYLIFIHGTASTTVGSFGKLANTREWETLLDIYGARILGFQHHTLSRSPIENALELARTLPRGVKIHLVTHSRGGLVGELLCLRPLHEEDMEPFRSERRDDDIQLLRALSHELAAKDIRVEKFVRVACPARGTVLASKRLDLYFSVMLNLLGLIPALQASPVYAFVKATLLELARRRTRPNEIPGIEAQMPESPVIHLLNRPGVATGADLAVIAGDIDGTGVWGNLKVMASDLFFWEDHDLVVNTRAMYGGMNREQGAYYYFERGTQVNHFSYFDNSSTRQRMLGWLTHKEGEKKDPNFKPILREGADLTVRKTRTAARDLPSVFIVPGIMGTHLKDNGGRIWLNFASLALGGIERLDISNNGSVTTDGLIGMAYQNLVNFLQNSYNVIPFPYDWRLSINTEGARLGKEIEAELKRHEHPVRIVAHSMGGLVVRAMAAQSTRLWKEVCARDGRLIMLGTPNLGSFIIPRLLFGKEKILRQLSLLDMNHRLSGVIGIIRQFPGLLEMLPESHSGVDFFDPAWWSTVPGGVEIPEIEAIAQAKETRQKLFKAGIPERTLYVAGAAHATASALKIGTKGDIYFETSPDGDGRVTYHPQFLKDVPTWYVNAQHGDLANHPSAFPGLVELLDRGRTNKLADSSDRRRAEVSTRTARIFDDAPLLFPNEDELTAAAIGVEMVEPQSKEPLTLRISVVHGDLAHASYPVAVGHYIGDAIVNAERRLDGLLKGRLSELFHVDLYPGLRGTVEVVYSPDAVSKGALIIGLGEVGEISPEVVRAGITSAALRFALMVANAPSDKSQGSETATKSWRSAAFSSLLIGTYGGNALNVESSITAIIQGTIQANQTLRAQGLWERVRIDEVELVELFEDVAIEAVRAASHLEKYPPLDADEDVSIKVDPVYLQHIGGGRFQRPSNQYDTGWWRRIQITGERDKKTGQPTGNLHYLALTDRARAEDTLQSTQRDLINIYIEQTINSFGYNQKIAATLFELLIPNALKSQTNIEANLVLVLDADAAQYPWELLAPQTQGGNQALALRMGLVRQFVTRDYNATPQPARDHGALVVGISKVRGALEAKYPEIPGARREAREVAKILSDAGYDVGTPLIDVDGPTVISDLVTRRYKILHLAGHGTFEPDYQEPDGLETPATDGRKKTGMVLGNGILLSTAELRTLGPIPELVFINCCHLGKMDNEWRLSNKSPHKLAASIAEELIRKGVKAIVAAGWAVSDEAASTFAAAFYEMMLSGQTFGLAVKHARQVTYKQFPDSNTWGAYQCYGNPGFVLEQTGKASSAEQERSLFSRSEYLEVLMGISEQAAAADPEQQEALRQRLRELDYSIPPHWRDGATLSALGEAWAALNSFDKAIEIYRQSIGDEKARAPINSIEQLANLLSRYALTLREQHEMRDILSDPAAATPALNLPALIKEAADLLEVVLQLGSTTERLAIYGGHYKRLATAADGEERRSLLEKAEDYYGRAHKRNRQKRSLHYYPTLNWITCRFLLGRRLKIKETLALIEECKKSAVREEGRERWFWNRIAEPDADLLAHLIKKDLAAQKNAIIESYRRVFDKGAKPKEVASVKGQLDSMIMLLKPADGKRAAAETIQALVEIKERIWKES